MSTSTADDNFSGTLSERVARLEGAVESVEDRQDRLERELEARRDSNAGIRKELGHHVADDAARFASLNALLTVNTALTESVKKRSAWTIGLLVSLVGLGFTLMGLVLHR